MIDCSFLMEYGHWDDPDKDPTYVDECPHCGGKLAETDIRCQTCGWQLTRLLNRRRLMMVLGVSLMTAKELAEAVSYTPTGIFYLIHGHRRARLEVLRTLQNTFNLPWNWFTVRPER